MDLPRRAPGVVSSEKQELLDAVRFGRKEPANPGEDGRQRWKFTHRAVVYIVNHSMSQEIVSWRIDGTDENIIPAMASDAETGTHVVLVVDASGSMRKDDVSGYPSRTSAVYDCLVKDFLTPQLQLLAGRGGGESSAIVTLIEMSDAATVIFEREPLYASLEGLFRQQMRTTARNHGNYLPALERASEVLLRDRGTNRQLFLIFMSDGAPSDHVGKECAHGIKVWSPVSSSRAGNGRFNREARPPLQVCAHGGATCRHSVKTDCEEKCRDQIVKIGDILGRDRTFIGTVAFGPTSEEFQVLQDMAGALPKGRFHKGGLSSGFLKTAFSSLSTSLTSLRTETGAAPLLVRIVPTSNGGRQAVHADHWDIYQEAVSERRGRAFLSKTKWEAAAKRFVAVPLAYGATGIAHANASFAQGAERLAWHCSEVNMALLPVGTKLVAKSTKHVNFLQDGEFHTSFCKVQGKAQEYTGSFNRRVQGLEVKPPLNLRFVECFVVSVRDFDLAWSDHDGVVKFLAEPELEGRFTKYNSNFGHVQSAAASSARTCTICLAHPREVRFACGHSALCRACLTTSLRSGAALRCPLCRTPVDRANLVVSGGIAGEATFLGGGGAPPAPSDGLNAIGEDEEEEEDGTDGAAGGQGGVRPAGRLGRVDVGDVPQAFSHFTFEESEGRELVCDLQGVWNAVDGFVLTDPVIHTERGREGRTDKGKEGMRRFFETHTCSDLCAILHLQPSAALLAAHPALINAASPISPFPRPRPRTSPFSQRASPQRTSPYRGIDSMDELLRSFAAGFQDF